jgi:hypothetical protein
MSERKNINATIVAEASEKKSVMFGWCMDGNDEECIGEFPGHRCRCECHSSTSEAVEVSA